MEVKDARVLIVDDQVMIRSMLIEILGEIGVKDVEEVEDGKAALERMKEIRSNGEEMHVIFLDWNMPEMTGYEFLMEIQNQDLMGDTKIVMQTTESESEKVMKALMAGVDDYVVKPYLAEQIVKKFTGIVTKL
ncbi:MAG: response regulator [Bdellovibrionales bacterium]